MVKFESLTALFLKGSKALSTGKITDVSKVLRRS